MKIERDGPAPLDALANRIIEFQRSYLIEPAQAIAEIDWRAGPWRGSRCGPETRHCLLKAAHEQLPGLGIFVDCGLRGSGRAQNGCSIRAPRCVQRAKQSPVGEPSVHHNHVSGLYLFSQRECGQLDDIATGPTQLGPTGQTRPAAWLPDLFVR